VDKFKQYWAYAAERAVKTIAQVAVATIGVSAIGIASVDWLGVLSVAALAGVVSLLTSVSNFNKPSA
jgi:spore maturation protein SpmA